MEQESNVLENKIYICNVIRFIATIIFILSLSFGAFTNNIYLFFVVIISILVIIIESFKKNNIIKSVEDDISNNPKYKTIETNKGEVENVLFGIDSIGKIKKVTNVTINFPNSKMNMTYSCGLKSEDKWPLENENEIKIDKSLNVGDNVVVKKQQLVLSKLGHKIYDEDRKNQINELKYTNMRYISVEEIKSIAPYYKILIEKEK